MSEYDATTAKTSLFEWMSDHPTEAREVFAWLVFCAIENGAVCKGEVCDAMGLHRIDVRDIAILGQAVADRYRAERMERVRAEVAAMIAAKGGAT
jgi:hypothetical protein